MCNLGGFEQNQRWPTEKRTSLQSQCCKVIQSFTQANEFDLHRAGKVPKQTGAGRKHIGHVKNTGLSLHELLYPGRNLLRVLFKTSLKSHLCTALTIQHTAQNKRFTSTNKTNKKPILQSRVFIVGIYRLLATNKTESIFPSANNLKGQLKTAQFVSVPLHKQECELWMVTDRCISHNSYCAFI